MTFIKITSHEEDYEILRCDLLLFAIFVIDNDTSTMSYVLKDHLGSMYATVTNGSVDYYSFDAWGRERNPNTFLYDNVPSHSFSRGFCMHEHYRDFGLINMNGRMYDPVVGRMLSPDIVIQNPEYSQSYNRYSYCFNNPLRFTDPSGYVVRNIWPPDDFSLGIDPYISLFDKENDITSSSYSLDESTGNDLWNVKRKTTYYFDVKDPNSISVNDEKHGKCVYLSLGEASKSLNKWDDNAKQWAQKNNDYYNSTGNQGYMTNNIIDYIIWNNIEKSYTDYNAQNINYKQIIDAYYSGSKIIVTMIFNGLYDDVVSSKGHAALLKSFTIWPNREVEFKFADPSPKRLLYDHKTSIDNFILPKYIESMQFIEFNLKSK